MILGIYPWNSRMSALLVLSFYLLWFKLQSVKKSPCNLTVKGKLFHVCPRDLEKLVKPYLCHSTSLIIRYRVFHCARPSTTKHRTIVAFMLTALVVLFTTPWHIETILIIPRHNLFCTKSIFNFKWDLFLIQFNFVASEIDLQVVNREFLFFCLCSWETVNVLGIQFLLWIQDYAN